MPSRTSWEGYLKVSLLSVPVKAYTATAAGKGRIGFHQLHAKCHSRIRYKKVCPIHGEVSNDEIVSGYEQEKDRYVVVEKGELAKLKPDADKTIEVEVFLDPADLDPVYFTDRTYYLVPDGRVAVKSYTVLQRVMAEENRYAVATMVFAGKEQLVCVRPAGRLLAVTFLNYSDRVKRAEEFEMEVPEVDVPAKEAELARGLVEASMAERFDIGAYKDRYSGDVLRLLEAKANRRGLKRPAAPTGEEPPAVTNLMDALRESLREVKKATGRRKRQAATRAVARPARRKGR
jgi:DNA end-binding protein Ku